MSDSMKIHGFAQTIEQWDLEFDGGTTETAAKYLAEKAKCVPDLVMLVRRLVRQVQKQDPKNVTAEAALDYLNRKGFKLNILRGEEHV